VSWSDSQPCTGRHNIAPNHSNYASSIITRTPGDLANVPFLDIRRSVAHLLVVTRYLVEQEIDLTQRIATPQPLLRHLRRSGRYPR